MKAMAMSTPDRDFHLGRGLLHGVLGFLVFLALAMAFTGTEPFGGSVEKLAEAAARQAVWAFLLAFVASYAFQTSRRTLGSLVLLVMVGLFVFQLYALARIAQARQDADSPLTLTERWRPGLSSRSGRLCQPALAFSFPSPPPRFVPASDTKGPSNLNDPYFAQWMWEDSSTREILIVQATKAAGRDEASFRSFTGGFKGSLTRRNPKIQVGPENARWAEESGEYATFFTLGGEERMEVRCLSRMAEDEKPPILICVQTTVRNSEDSLRQVRTGLSLGPCGTVTG